MKPNIMVNKATKEMDAQLKRAQARLYLEKQGCGPSKHESIIAKSGLVSALSQKSKDTSSPFSRDNTMTLLKKRKAETETKRTYSSGCSLTCGGKSIKCDQNDGDVIEKLPVNWAAVEDPHSSKIYYWNKVTNETSWSLPKQTVAAQDVSDCPYGWKDVVHPATGQKYFIHKDSGEKSWTLPKADQPKVFKSQCLSARQDYPIQSHSSHTKENSIDKAGVDPLDPTQGRVLNNKESVGRMADSTASGPLWQQRPLPAPGLVLKQHNKNTVTDNPVGPTIPR